MGGCIEIVKGLAIDAVELDGECRSQILEKRRIGDGDDVRGRRRSMTMRDRPEAEQAERNSFRATSPLSPVPGSWKLTSGKSSTKRSGRSKRKAWRSGAATRRRSAACRSGSARVWPRRPWSSRDRGRLIPALAGPQRRPPPIHGHDQKPREAGEASLTRQACVRRCQNGSVHRHGSHRATTLASDAPPSPRGLTSAFALTFEGFNFAILPVCGVCATSGAACQKPLPKFKHEASCRFSDVAGFELTCGLEGICRPTARSGRRRRNVDFPASPDTGTPEDALHYDLRLSFHD